MGRDTAKTADPNRPKGYPIPYEIMLSNKNWRKKEKVGGGDIFEVTAFVFPSNRHM